MSNELKKVQEFFSAPETPNQLAWGYAHMAMHHILTSNDDVDLGITPQSTLLEVAEVAHKHGVSLDFNTRPNEWKAVSEKLAEVLFNERFPNYVGDKGKTFKADIIEKYLTEALSQPPKQEKMR